MDVGPNNLFMPIEKDKVFKGHTSTYIYSIPYTEMYEPFIVSLYELMLNEDKEEVFIKNIYLNKKTIKTKLKIKNNVEFYQDSFINR